MAGRFFDRLRKAVRATTAAVAVFLPETDIAIVNGLTLVTHNTAEFSSAESPRPLPCVRLPNGPSVIRAFPTQSTLSPADDRIYGCENGFTIVTPSYSAPSSMSSE